MTFPEPVIEHRHRAEDQGRTTTSSATALAQLADEDPTFRVRTDEETGQTIIAGMGELHLEIIVDRLMREFKVEANVGKPQVAYRETIRKSARRSRAASSGRPAAAASSATSARGRAQRARRGLRLRERHRWRHPEGVHPGGREGHPRRWSGGVSPAIPWSTLKVDLVDGSLPRGRLLRDRLQSPGPWPFRRRQRAGLPPRARDGGRGRAPEEYLGEVIGDLNARRGRILVMDAAARRAR